MGGCLGGEGGEVEEGVTQDQEEIWGGDDMFAVLMVVLTSQSCTYVKTANCTFSVCAHVRQKELTQRRFTLLRT